MEVKEKNTVATHAKALRINLDASRYGTIAEIGAGQEVSGWFFRVGGASGTIAKTMSAYDMKFSDEIYGEAERYVSKGRLLAMLDHEYGLLEERLDESRGAESTFFAFADTISARNYHGTNICHGWMGLRFQQSPKQEPSNVVLHINLNDNTSLQQQQAVGILGVNLIHGAFFSSDSPEALLTSLMDGLSLDRIEIDAIEISGPAFKDVDNRLLALHLLRLDLAKVVALPADHETNVAPMSLVYKSPIVIERGLFLDVDARHIDMLRRGEAVLRQEVPNSRNPPVPLVEMTLRYVHGAEQDLESVYERVIELQKKGFSVLVSVFPEYYHLTRYLTRYTSEPIRFVVGAVSVLQLLSEGYYNHLAGGLVEAMGRLMAANVKIYVFSMDRDVFCNSRAFQTLGEDWNVSKAAKVSLATIEPKNSSRHLYRYLVDVRALESLD